MPQKKVIAFFKNFFRVSRFSEFRIPNPEFSSKKFKKLSFKRK